MVLYNGMTALDLVGPQLYFSSLGDVTIHLVSKTLEPVVSDTGLAIVPTVTFANCPDTLLLLFVPGGSAGTLAALHDSQTIAFLKERGAEATWVTSVCTGALLLGAAGLLEGYRATTHWVARNLLTECGAMAQNERVVVDGNRITGAGVSAGLDLGLLVVKLLRGETRARMAALNSEYAPAPCVVAGTPEQAGPEVTRTVEAHYAELTAGLRAALKAR